MTGSLVIHAHAMGSFVGERPPQRDHTDTCPGCGGIKSADAQTCITCSPRRQVKRSAEAMDRHHRFEAAIQAGWSERGLIYSRPALPTWEEICRRCPDAVAKWHPELVVERFFECQD